MRKFSEFIAAQGQPVQQAMPKPHKWKASKDEIIQYWRGLRPNTPIAMMPTPYQHTGSTYAEDGVRITGSKEFISSVLSRLKEFLNFESPRVKLALVYRETESPSQTAIQQNKTSYVFYVQAKERGAGKQTTPKLPGIPHVKAPKI